MSRLGPRGGFANFAERAAKFRDGYFYPNNFHFIIFRLKRPRRGLRIFPIIQFAGWLPQSPFNHEPPRLRSLQILNMENKS